jgi:hypothetical protein
MFARYRIFEAFSFYDAMLVNLMLARMGARGLAFLSLSWAQEAPGSSPGAPTTNSPN